MDDYGRSKREPEIFVTETITIEPLTRIEGHARITIELDEAGNVADTRLHILSLRGFEQFICGRPAEEIPRIVTRICGICPWMHHLASVKAVDACFGVNPPPTGALLRELCQVMAHINDKILHFFFLAAPDFILGPDADYSVRSIMGIVKARPELAARVARMRKLGQQLLEDFAGRAIHPVAGVSGGFSKPMSENDRQRLQQGCRTLLDFAVFALAFGRDEVLNRYQDILQTLGGIETGFLGTVDANGAMRLYDGNLRLMKTDGTYTDFAPELYKQHIKEHVESWSYGKMPWADGWKEGFSMDLDRPRGIYRTNTLARINICDHISTPIAQEALDEFRKLFGRPAQGTLLYHWARLIELIYACERSLELLADDRISGNEIRTTVHPGPGRGVGHVEAPRGTLIHEYTTDENGCITSANMIVGTTHNLAPMNMSVRRAATDLIKNGHYDEPILNKIEMAVRAYDP